VFGFRHVLRALPEARRDQLSNDMRRQFRELAPSLSGMREAQRELRFALGAEPYEPQAVELALEGFRDHLLASQLASHRTFVAIAGTLTPEERRLLRDALERPHHRSHGPPRADRDGPRSPAPK
jgi:uncharacterized membrane protein